MRHTKVNTVHRGGSPLRIFVFLVWTSSFAFSQTSLADEVIGRECSPGWNAKMERLRAAQRAHACAGTATMSECRAMMGLGAVGIVSAAKARSSIGARNAAQLVRDSEFHPCPLPGRASAQHRFLGLIALEPAWAACVSRLDIHRATISNAVSDLTDEVDNAIALAKESLRAMSDLETDLGKLSPQEQAKKIAEVANRSVTDYSAEYVKAQRELETNRNGRGYQLRLNEQMDAEDLKNKKLREFKTLFNRYFGRPFHMENDAMLDLTSMSERLTPDERSRFSAVRKELYDASISEYTAKRKVDDVLRDPHVKGLQTKVDNLGTSATRIRQLGRSPDEFQLKLKKEAAALRESLSTLEKSKEALVDFAQAAKAAKTSGDLFAIGDRVRHFIPKEFLSEAGSRVYTSASAGLRATLEGLVAIEGRMTDVSHDLIRKWSAHLPSAGAGLRTTVSLAAKGLAFVAGGLVTGVTFAGNEFVSGCPGVVSSANFPADPSKSCARDFSFDNPAAAKLAAMNSQDLCELAKADPIMSGDIDALIGSNYNHFYPDVRGQCGTPLKLTSPRWGNLTYDGKETLFTPVGESKPLAIAYDDRGNERSMRLPKYIRSGGTEQVDWGESAPIGYGDRHKQATRIYRDMIRPVLAEATACCSGTGVTPPFADCARWGLTEGRHQQQRAGPTTR